MTRRIVFAFLFFYLSLVVLPKFCFQQTGNFWFQTILSKRTSDPRWETPPPTSEELTEINTILSQSFTFLGGGMQSFVFLSEDRSTVIKFFKHRPSILKKGRFRTHTPYLDSIFNSYHIAFNQLKDETGVFYIHLNKTDGLHPRLTLIDKIGTRHYIELDGTEFVLQKRADLICPKLRVLMESKDIDGAKQSIEALVCSLKGIYEKGVKNNDKAFRRNVGIVGQKAVLFDAGSLFLNSGIYNSSEAKKDVLQKGINLEKWLMKHYPQLYDHYLEHINLVFGGEHDS